MSGDPEYQLGSHAAQLENIEKRMEAIEEKLDCTIRYIERQKGVVGTIISVASAISAAATALVMKWFHIGGSA